MSVATLRAYMQKGARPRLCLKRRAHRWRAFGAEGADVIFTSGATEAAGLAMADLGLAAADVEHDAVLSWRTTELATDGQGRVAVIDPAQAALQMANSETGVVQELPGGLALCDMTQAFGKLPIAFNWSG